ncbi:hypothetical protein LHJ74_04500 [Streptomyces sp. N2-109]|uniref:Uncharacterized protein n=1 Tax=Streptomyces gossypii TaxID=2883101 RepID=A0ABT2JMU1_9ACTN|nr:hypothetical protein [Streptomyces gossypii]MCT2589199.1 hypothetical protein [Streptomyces gossypii]
MTSALNAIPGIIFITLSYAALCAVSPFGTCRKCQGFGCQIRESRLTGRLKAGRVCRRCQGYGRRLRFGRWLYNHASRLHRDGTR